VDLLGVDLTLFASLY
jgi:hypothetical protein